MNNNPFDRTNTEITWCPGCGNFGLRNIVLKALSELNLPQEHVVFVSGIGQAAKAPQYMNTSYFNGLHGRSLPPATGIKAANPNLVVIVESGDGDMYGEGGNHFIHTIRRNPDITVIVHNNMVYGLTKGQASPTSQVGMKTPIQVDGVGGSPFNPLAVAISLDASFVARGSAGEQEKTKEMIKRAIVHKGFALVDVFQACVSFNKINTHQWYKQHTYFLEPDYDPSNRLKAFERALEADPLPLGIFYVNEGKSVFEENQRAFIHTKEPLFKRRIKPSQVDVLLNKKI
jgi:2-oxoglutarate ferredoxin oxidoreductase subunit beta